MGWDGTLPPPIYVYIICTRTLLHNPIQTHKQRFGGPFPSSSNLRSPYAKLNDPFAFCLSPLGSTIFLIVVTCTTATAHSTNGPQVWAQFFLFLTKIFIYKNTWDVYFIFKKINKLIWNLFMKSKNNYLLFFILFYFGTFLFTCGTYLFIKKMIA